MGRNNPKNIKAHNDKLHKEQEKAKAKKVASEEKRKEIMRKFNQNKTAWKAVIAEAELLMIPAANCLSTEQ